MPSTYMMIHRLFDKGKLNSTEIIHRTKSELSKATIENLRKPEYQCSPAIRRVLTRFYKRFFDEKASVSSDYTKYAALYPRAAESLFDLYKLMRADKNFKLETAFDSIKDLVRHGIEVHDDKLGKARCHWLWGEIVSDRFFADRRLCIKFEDAEAYLLNLGRNPEDVLSLELSKKVNRLTVCPPTQEHNEWIDESIKHYKSALEIIQDLDYPNQIFSLYSNIFDLLIARYKGRQLDKIQEIGSLIDDQVFRNSIDEALTDEPYNWKAARYGLSIASLSKDRDLVLKYWKCLSEGVDRGFKSINFEPLHVPSIERGRTLEFARLVINEQKRMLREEANNQATEKQL